MKNPIKTAKTLGKLPIALGILVATAAIGIWVIMGAIYSDSEARRLYEALGSSSLYFASAVATSSTTVIALILALLGLTHRSDHEWDIDVYRKLRLTALFGVLGLSVAIILLLFLSAPAEEADTIPNWWFSYLYPIMYFIDALLAIIMVMTAGLLYGTVTNVIEQLSPKA